MYMRMHVYKYMPCRLRANLHTTVVGRCNVACCCLLQPCCWHTSPFPCAGHPHPFQRTGLPQLLEGYVPAQKLTRIRRLCLVPQSTPTNQAGRICQTSAGKQKECGRRSLILDIFTYIYIHMYVYKMLILPRSLLGLPIGIPTSRGLTFTRIWRYPALNISSTIMPDWKVSTFSWPTKGVPFRQ